MSIYSWLVVLLLLFAVILQGNIKGNKKYLAVAFILLFCIMGLRDVHSIGCDSTSSYLQAFYDMEITKWGELSGRGEDNFNIGFDCLLKLGYELTGGDYQLFIAMLSAIILFSYIRFIRKYSPSPIQSVLYFLGLMFFTFLFDALKQAVAMAVLVFAFDAIMEKKPIKFVVLVLLATQFHFPALVFLPAYWLGKIKVGRSYLLVLSAMLLLTYLFRDELLKFMLKAYGGDQIDATMDGVKFLRNKVIIMIIIVVAALVLRPPTDSDSVYNVLLMFMGVAIIFQTFCGYNNIFERLADYYFHFSIVFIPLVFEKCDLKKRYLSPRADIMLKSMAPVVFCAFAIWRFVTSVDSNNLLSPYIFFFQNTIR